MRLAVPLLALALISGCKPPTLGAVRVRVVFRDDNTTRCVKVKATTDAGANYFSNAAVRDGQDELQFGISESGGLTGKIHVTVILWTNPSCSGAEVTPPVPSQDVTLTRNSPPTELVFEIVGCTSATCPPPSCRGPQVCRDGGCSYPVLDAGAACDGGMCTAAGVCVPGTPCITGELCDDGLACTRPDRCVDAGVCAGTLACQTPPPCWKTLASCAPDGGCAITIDSSLNYRNCGGERACLPSGDCVAWFPYTPSVRLENVPYPDAGWSFSGPCLAAYDTSTLAVVNDPQVSWCSTTPPVPTVLSQDGGLEVVVFTMSSLSIPAGVTTQFVGSRPVVLVVFGDATIEGVLSVQGGFGSPGAGGDPLGCGRGGAGTIRGGGGGGAFGTSGGNGAEPGGGARGVFNGEALLVPLRGGCSGGEGAGNADGGGLAAGGLQISVAGRLLVDGGAISAPGGGGLGGDGGTAGGGGASGGGLLVEARDLWIVGGAVTANGGSGGEGSNSSGGDLGSHGEAGHLFDALPARTTPSSCCASNGGQGAAGSFGAGDAGAPDGGAAPGGGGGGGGLGRLRLNVWRGCLLDAGTVSGNASSGVVPCP